MVEDNFTNEDQQDLMEMSKRFGLHLSNSTNSRPYEELIVPVQGIIKSVSSQTNQIRHTPFSERISGSLSPVYDVGFNSQLEIELEEKGLPKLIFYGFSPIISNDMIRAYVFKGQAINDPDAPIQRFHPSSKEKFILRDKFSEQEEALYIEILKENKIVRTDYGINYQQK